MSELDHGLDLAPNWDLTGLYNSYKDPRIEQDLDNLSSEIDNFIANYRDVENLDGLEFYDSVVEYEKIGSTLHKISAYAYLLKSTNMNDSEISIFNQKIEENVSDLSRKMIPYALGLIEISDENLESKISQDDRLEFYKPFFRNERIAKPYILDKNMESLLQEKAITGKDAWNRLFNETMTKLRFDFQGEKLNEEEILSKKSSKSADERKEAYDSIVNVLQENTDLLTMITNVLAKDKSIEDNLRGYKKPISSRNLANFIEDDSVVDLLIETVQDNYKDICERYFKIKANVFGDDKLNYWDKSAPYPDSAKKQFNWKEAKETVIESYSKFDPRFGEMAARFFDEKWIDAAVYNGKRGGAYAMEMPKGHHPYVLTNFQGNIRDVATIAHEIGHGIHFMFAEKQGNLMSHAPLILAETASVFGEMLNFRNIIEKLDNDHDRFYMLTNKIEDMIATAIRQIIYCDFEIQVHDGRKNGELSTERINEIWSDVQKKAYGDSMDISDNYFWSYIPHFIHTPFYVYSYAFGECFVNSLYKFYMENPDGFVEKYVDLLSSGKTLRYDEIMEKFNMNPKTKEFWQGGLDLIIEMIDEAEDLGRKINIIKNG